MPDLLIRDIPKEISDAVAELAKRERRSKEKQALVLIERGLALKPQPQGVLKLAKGIRSRFKRSVSLEDILSATEEPH